MLLHRNEEQRINGLIILDAVNMSDLTFKKNTELSLKHSPTIINTGVSMH